MKNNSNIYKLVGSKFIFIVLLVLLSITIYAHILLLEDNPMTTKKIQNYIFGFYTFLVVGLIYAYNTVTKRVIITKDKIVYTSLFKKYEIALNTIKQFRVKIFSIHLSTTDHKEFKLFKNPYLSKWLENNFEQTLN